MFGLVPSSSHALCAYIFLHNFPPDKLITSYYYDYINYSCIQLHSILCLLIAVLVAPSKSCYVTESWLFFRREPQRQMTRLPTESVSACHRILPVFEARDCCIRLHALDETFLLSRRWKILLWVVGYRIIRLFLPESATGTCYNKWDNLLQFISIRSVDCCIRNVDFAFFTQMGLLLSNLFTKQANAACKEIFSKHHRPWHLCWKIDPVTWQMNRGAVRAVLQQIHVDQCYFKGRFGYRIRSRFVWHIHFDLVFNVLLSPQVETETAPWSIELISKWLWNHSCCPFWKPAPGVMRFLHHYWRYLDWRRHT